ncbi:MAG: hypothetical protein QXE01_12245 [Sulfolobales archaeon]
MGLVIPMGSPGSGAMENPSKSGYVISHEIPRVFGIDLSRIGFSIPDLNLTTCGREKWRGEVEW